MKVFVLLGYAFGRTRALQLHAQGKTPEPSFYGFHHAAGMVDQLTLSEGSRQRGLAWALHFALVKGLGFDPLQAWRHREAIFKADIVWTMTEREGLAVAALCRWWKPRAKPPRIICQTIWLLNEWPGLPAWRRRLYTRLLAHCDAITTHSRRYIALAPQRLGPALGARVEFMAFGVARQAHWRALDAGAPAQTRNTGSLHIVCAGNDRTRDWDIVHRVAARLPQHRFSIFCSWAPQPSPSAPGQVTVHHDADIAQLREAYGQADVVLIPMKENDFSGITVAMEAAAFGIACISAQTGGVGSYFNEDEVLYYPPGDVEALAARIQSIAQDPAVAHPRCLRAQARFARDDLSTEGLMRRYVALSRRVLETSADR